MKKIIFSSILLLSSYTTLGVIYGTDSRQEAESFVPSSTSAFRSEMLDSVAAMISDRNIEKVNGSYIVKGRLAGSKRKFCSEIPFQKQVSVASCSGFLIGEDILLTASFCVPDPKGCTGFKWVFNFKLNRSKENRIVIPEQDVYSCSKVLKSRNGYSALKLNRPVLNTKPLKFRKKGMINVEDRLIMAGFPDGVVMKVADDAFVRSIKGNLLNTNLDAFAGNAGSPVFNEKTGLVEGILLSGEVDFSINQQKACTELNYCSDYSCRGEDVISIKSSELEELL